MSTPFDGKWTDQPGSVITITSKADILTVQYNNGRPSFTGAAAAVGAPVIYVNFTDDAPFTGVLTVDGKQIYWSNTTIWTKS